MKEKSLLFATVKKFNTNKDINKSVIKQENIYVKKYGNNKIIPLNYYKNISQIVELK